MRRITLLAAGPHRFVLGRPRARAACLLAPLPPPQKLPVLGGRPPRALTTDASAGGPGGAGTPGRGVWGASGAGGGAAEATIGGAPPAAAAEARAGAKAAVEAPTNRQLWQLGLASAVPFIGFGFADNLIMILAGDAIDATLGVALGLTTLAAAGFGNLISDVAGIGLGEMIEARAAAMGFSAPKLAPEQFELSRTRFVKGVSGAVGISIGCLLGMFPLLLLGGRKHAIYLTSEEELLYATHFARYGVSPQQFYELMRHARWRSADVDGVLVEPSRKLPKVLMLLEGKAIVRKQPGAAPARRFYEGRHERGELKQRSTGGCIIGGTALVDPAVLGKPYPNQIVAAEPCRWVEWDTEELKATMNKDPAIEAAVLQTLYTDLLQGLKHSGASRKALSSQPSIPLQLQRSVRAGGASAVGPSVGQHGGPAAVAASGPDAAPARQPSAGGAAGDEEARAEAEATQAAQQAAAADGASADLAYALAVDPSLPAEERLYETLLRAILAEGVVHPAERMLVTDFRRAKGIGADIHERALRRIGWSAEEWAAGMQRVPPEGREGDEAAEGGGGGGGTAGGGGAGGERGGLSLSDYYTSGYTEFVRRGKQDLHKAEAEATRAEGGLRTRRTSALPLALQTPPAEPATGATAGAAGAAGRPEAEPRAGQRAEGKR